MGIFQAVEIDSNKQVLVRFEHRCHIEKVGKLITQWMPLVQTEKENKAITKALAGDFSYTGDEYSDKLYAAAFSARFDTIYVVRTDGTHERKSLSEFLGDDFQEVVAEVTTLNAFEQVFAKSDQVIQTAIDKRVEEAKQRINGEDGEKAVAKLKELFPDLFANGLNPITKLVVIDDFSERKKNDFIHSRVPKGPIGAILLDEFVLYSYLSSDTTYFVLMEYNKYEYAQFPDDYPFVDKGNFDSNERISRHYQAFHINGDDGRCVLLARAIKSIREDKEFRRTKHNNGH